MGSFSYTCTVSDLPIEYGDRVRYLLLTENPYDGRNNCYPSDVWFPRTFPVKAAYNDYGSIEEYDEKALHTVLLLKGFEQDLHEVGVGDNSYHDIPARRGMSFSQYLDALREKRVRVRNPVGPSPRQAVPGSPAAEDPEIAALVGIGRAAEAQVSDGIPSLATVEGVLTAAGFKAVNGKEEEGFTVGEIRPQWCRVRSTSYNRRKAELEKMLSVLQQHFAAMITVGSGYYPDECEIHVMPAPTPANRERHVTLMFEDSRAKSTLAVAPAMIREDVWQALLTEKMQVYNAETHDFDFVGLKDARETVQQAFALASQFSKNKKQPAYELKQAFQDKMRELPFGNAFVPNELTCQFEPAESLKLAAAHKSTFTTRQIEDFLDEAAEWALVSQVLSGTRYWWRPSYSCGPQQGEWPLHRRLLTKYLGVAEKVVLKQQEEDDLEPEDET